jgi:hypothetical protein
MDGRRDAQAGSNAPLRASLLGERQTVVLWGILDHTAGPARSASIKPISDVAPALLHSTLFHARWCARGAWLTVGEPASAYGRDSVWYAQTKAMARLILCERGEENVTQT